MIVKNIKEPKKFFEKLNECVGTVELITKEGDRLNLKSKLCQYIALSDLFAKATLDEIEIVLSEPEDYNKIINFLVRG